MYVYYFGKTQKYGMIQEKKYTSISTLILSKVKNHPQKWLNACLMKL